MNGRLIWTLSFLGLVWVPVPSQADYGWGVPQNLGPGVNTAIFEYGPNLAVTQDTLYFERSNGTVESESILVSIKQGGVWGQSVSVGDSINNFPGYFLVSPFISYDGSRLYFTLYPDTNTLDPHIYYSVRRKGIWQGPKRFEAAFNNDSFGACWPCFTHDGRRIYFYSYKRPGGVGKGDLWYSDYDTLAGVWGPPVNLGDSINTPQWDCCPALSWDDQTLYFVSDTLPTEVMHVCRSRMVNGVWQKGVMFDGYPNNPGGGDSNYPCLSSDGKNLYFAGAYVPWPNYGWLDIYVSTWDLGVETSPPPVRNREGPELQFQNPLRPGARVSIVGNNPGGSLKMSLFDLQGRRVRSWSGTELRGKSLWWDGRDGTGRLLSSGVYFFQLALGNTKLLSKALILR